MTDTIAQQATNPDSFSVAPPDALPLPLLLYCHGPVAAQLYESLRRERRLELFVTGELSAQWVALSLRCAGSIVVSEGDPIGALVYALTAGVTGPFVVVTQKRYQRDSAVVLRAGAVACISMPVGAHETERLLPLLQRRHCSPIIHAKLRLHFDPIGRTIRYRDGSIRLSPREYAIIDLLGTYQGRPVATEYLLKVVWGSALKSRSQETLEVYVQRLRTKLGKLGLKGCLTTVRGYGYALGDMPFDSSP